MQLRSCLQHALALLILRPPAVPIGSNLPSGDFFLPNGARLESTGDLVPLVATMHNGSESDAATTNGVAATLYSTGPLASQAASSARSYFVQNAMNFTPLNKLWDAVVRQTPASAEVALPVPHQEAGVDIDSMEKDPSTVWSSPLNLLQLRRPANDNETLEDPTTVILDKPPGKEHVEDGDVRHGMDRLLRAAPGARVAGHVILISAFLCLL